MMLGNMLEFLPVKHLIIDPVVTLKSHLFLKFRVCNFCSNILISFKTKGPTQSVAEMVKDITKERRLVRLLLSEN